MAAATGSGRARRTVLAGLALALAAAADARAELVIGTAGPISGELAYLGEQQVRGVQRAVDDLNAAGGLLGQTVSVINVDDACDGAQAEAAAAKLVADGVAVVIGHVCSGASIPASAVYARAGMLMISPSSTNPQLTEQGFDRVFRVCGRDDQQGAIAGDAIRAGWPAAAVAILHDGSVYGQGLAEETRRRIAAGGAAPAVFEAIQTGQSDYGPVLARLQQAGIRLLYFGGYAPDAAMLARQTREMGFPVQLISGDALAVQDFWMIAGEAGEGTRFTYFPDARLNPQARTVVEAFAAEGYAADGETLNNYAAVEIWAAAVRAAGTAEPGAVAAALRGQDWPSVLGRVGFDGKGDIRQPGFTWYVWSAGEYRVDPQAAN